MKFLFAAAISLASFTAITADAQMRRGDQFEAHEARRAGALRPLREIEREVVPRLQRRGAEYIGAELVDGSARYRLKFMREGSVIWVDVDGRTGTVVGRAGD